MFGRVFGDDDNQNKVIYKRAATAVTTLFNDLLLPLLVFVVVVHWGSKELALLENESSLNLSLLVLVLEGWRQFWVD